MVNNNLRNVLNVFQSSRTLDGINQIKTLPYSINGTLGGLLTKVSTASLFPYI